jgi:hypothetical protein
MTKLILLNEVETEMLSGGWGRRSGFTLGSYNDTFTQLAGIDQSSNQTAISFGGFSGNLAVQLAGISNYID